MHTYTPVISERNRGKVAQIPLGFGENLESSGRNLARCRLGTLFLQGERVLFNFERGEEQALKKQWDIPARQIETSVVLRLVK
jgi:hypothetical protein